MNPQKYLQKLKKGSIVLVETSQHELLPTHLKTVRHLSKKGYFGVVVSASRPYQDLLAHYAPHKISSDDLFVIDCISEGEGEQTDNAIYVESPCSLTEISLAIIEVINQVEGKKYVFIDSMDSFLIHNKPVLFAKFVHYIFTKMRLHDTLCIVLTINKNQDDKIKTEIAEICDEVMVLK
jgi:hypothetical protein